MNTLNTSIGIQKLKEILQEYDSCMYIERDNFFDKHYSFVKSEEDIKQMRIAIKTAEIKKGSRVKVDFSHEPDKGLKKIRFMGNGTVDLFEDDRVFGRLDDGRPFCCLVSDIEIQESKDRQSKILQNFVGHDESKAINKTYLFLILMSFCAVVKGCGQ